MNDDYAKGTMFGGRIAHGMLVAGLISAVLGTMLPGPGAIYMSQQLRFLAPVRPGDQVTARAMVTEWDPDKGRVTLSDGCQKPGGCCCHIGGGTPCHVIVLKEIGRGYINKRWQKRRCHYDFQYRSGKGTILGFFFQIAEG